MLERVLRVGDVVSGRVSGWNYQRGFGFIRIPDVHADLFLHVSALPGGRQELTIGDSVRLEIGLDRTGRLVGRNVVLIQ